MINLLYVALPLTTALASLSELLGVSSAEGSMLCHLDGEHDLRHSNGSGFSHGLPGGSGYPRSTNGRAREAEGYLAELVRHRQHHPGDDLLSVLVGAADGKPRDVVELVSGYVTTLRHGLEMTAHLLGNGMLALATDPDQQCLLRHRLDELMPTALDEILRIDPPVQAVVRRLTVSRIVGGTYITAPAQIAIMIGAGNHDPAHFTSPESLRVDRAESAPLSYGADVPTCTGGRLAHLLAEVFFTTMLRRFSDVQLGPAPSYRPDRMLRGLRELHVNALNAA